MIKDSTPAGQALWLPGREGGRGLTSPHLMANGGTAEGSSEERTATEGKGRGRATGCTSVRHHKRPGE